MRRIFFAILLSLAVSGILISSGCSKSNPVDGHVQTITSGGNVTTLTYDNQGRLSTYTNANGTVTFTYSSNSVTVNNGGAATIFSLNSSGYASGNGIGLTYSYDNNGEWTNTAGNGNTVTYAYSNGNITSVTSGNVTQDAATYTNTTDYRNYGIYFFGKNGAEFNGQAFFPKSANLLNTDQKGSTTYQASYTYDSKGRVSTETVTGGGTTTTNVYTYTN